MYMISFILGALNILDIFMNDKVEFCWHLHGFQKFTVVIRERFRTVTTKRHKLFTLAMELQQPIFLE